jgi:hypothetical protein
MLLTPHDLSGVLREEESPALAAMIMESYVAGRLYDFDAPA